MEEEPKNDFQAREYQIELFEKAREHNSIIFLPTGSGKTFIAVMLIKDMSKDIEKKYSEGGKRTFFLVCTVALAQQQAAAIKKQVPFNVGTYTGDMGVDYWTGDRWLQELEQNEILVMTAQIFLDLLRHNYISLNRVNLIVMDECHHAVNKHPMRQIMENFEGLDQNERPRILGLTATLLNSNVKSDQIESEIHKLEVTLQAKICRAQNESMLKKYSTNPEEKIVFFDSTLEEPDVCKEFIISNINAMKLLIKDILADEDETQIIAPDGSTCLPQKKSEIAKVVNMLTDIVEIANKLGTFAASYALLARLFNMERLKLSCIDKNLHLTYSMITTKIHEIRKIIRLQMCQYSAVDQPMVYSSQRLKSLFKEMENFDSTKNAIIFVQRRITAQVLYYVFKYLSENNEKFKDIKPDFIVGCNANPFTNTREPELEGKKNKAILRRFNQSETNVLFASDVIEEGIDIPNCSYVMKFDQPATLCSYIQSKGRARDSTSVYIIFADQSNFLDTHKVYKAAEEALLKKLSSGKADYRPGGTEAEALKELYLKTKPYYVDGPGSAVVTVDSALSLLNRYCNSLPSDKFTKLTVLYWKKEFPGNKVVINLMLPMNSPLREVIEGEPCDNIAAAKASAAFKACKRLHQIKELNDRLLPVGPEIDIDESTKFPLWVDKDEGTGGTGEKIRAGTKKRIRVYEKKFPNCMCSCPPKSGGKTYVHLLRITPNYECPDTNRHKTFYNLLSSSNSFALLTSKPWPKVCEFPMFMNVGEVKIKLEENYCIKVFSTKELKDISDFHCLLVTDALPIKSRKVFLVKDLEGDINSYYIAPVVERGAQGFDLDWNTIKYHKTIPSANPIPLENRREFNVTKEKYHCKVVIPWYRPSSLMLRYIVTKVCDEQNPLSPFPSENYTSYADYFSSRYNQKIVNVTQPLLEVRVISQKNNCLLPRRRTRLGKRKKRDEEDLEEVLVPELCCLLEFPAVYLLKVTLIPSVMHRLSLLFLAEELRVKIATEVPLGSIVMRKDHSWDPLRIDEAAVNSDEEQQVKSTIDISNMLASEMESLNPSDCSWDLADEPCDIDRNLETVDLLSIIYYDKFIRTQIDSDKKEKSTYSGLLENVPVPKIPYLDMTKTSSGPQLSELLQAVIGKGGNDIMNYERLETLGDSFLKFITCLVLFTYFPDKDEGKLTNIKGKVVGNRNLFYCGRNIHLGTFIKISAFAPEDWDIPHFKLLDVIKNIMKETKISPSILYRLNLTEVEQNTGLLSEKTLDQLYELLCNTSLNEGGTQEALNMLQQEAVSDKAIADCVEALIGVYLKTFGIEGAFRFCKWLRLIPDDWTDMHKVLYEPAPTAHLNCTLTVEDFLVKPKDLEEKLGYKFKDRSFLLQALSHSSFAQYATDCYQRLEFLGDAILDFLITCHIYDKCSNLGPGELTDLRSALVNNVTFACLTVKYGFHKFILSKALSLSRAINKFAEQQDKRDHKIGAEVLLMVNENDVKVGEMMDVPKILSDVFESLAGAVYLDSGKSLQTVWKVFYRLMHNEIREFSKDVPKNNIRLLFEKFPSPRPCFESPSNWDSKNKGVLISVTISHNGDRRTFYGYGDNKASAKMAAAKIALRHYHKSGHDSTS